MTRILIAGYQHETNTFAPSLADWAAFNTGENFPAFVRGQAFEVQYLRTGFTERREQAAFTGTRHAADDGEIEPRG
mgnify:CR=1 FL=1